MKVKMIGMVLLLVISHSCMAQTFAEWFNQKKTQTKYLTQQVALFQLYLGYLKKGYDIADKGLTLIGDIKDGDFNIHKDYFNSLSTVSPTVKRADDVAKIMEYMTLIHQGCQRVTGNDILSRQLSAQERETVNGILGNLELLAMEDVARLVDILTDGTFKLKTSERLDHIGSIHADIVDKYNFLCSLLDDNKTLAIDRVKALEDIGLLNRQHEQ
jgi:hypothetical protein